MPARDLVGLVLSGGMIGAMWWGSSFELEQIMMGELATTAGGKYKFLTILNMYLQMFYFAICIVNFFVGSNTLVETQRSTLQKLRDTLFAGAAFPIATFVCISFWGLYHFDRKLIFPKELDQLVSPTLNHAMHTLPGLGIWLEGLFHRHRYPLRRVGLAFVLAINVCYMAWIHYLHHLHWVQFNRSLWVYPVLNELPFIFRGLFFLGSTLFSFGLYFIGEMYTLCLTNFRIDKRDRAKKKF